MAIVDGWVSWARRVPGPVRKLTEGTNPNYGLVAHSMEGYVSGAMSILADVSPPLSKRTSWHFSNLLTGELLQHYPIFARCWHGTAFNQSYVGCEHEGLQGTPINSAQESTLVSLISELSIDRGWRPKRPSYIPDLTATLYDHRETVWFGGDPTACPSSRINWSSVMMQLNNTQNNRNEALKYRGLVTLIEALSNDYTVWLREDKTAWEFFDEGSNLIASLPVKSLPDWFENMPPI